MRKRRQILHQLGRSQDSRAREIILDGLNDESGLVQTAAVTALGELGDPRAVGPLVRLLDSASLELRRSAALALGKLGDRRALRPLLTFALQSPEHKFVSVEAITDIGPAAIPELLDVLNDQNDGIVLEAISHLGRLQEKRPVAALCAVLETRPAPFQARAAEALGRIADPRAVPRLLLLLQSPDADVRQQTAKALAELPDVKSVRPLIRALSDSVTTVRIHAAAALGNISDPRAAGPLCRLLNDDHPPLRLAAAEALGKIGDPRAVGPLLELLNTPDETIQLKAVRALKAIKSPQVVPAVLPLLSHRSEAVRLKAIDTLGAVGGSEVVGPLAEVLTSHPSEELRTAAVRALGNVGDSRAIPVLEDALRSEFSVRCRAVIALGDIGDPATMPALLAMLKDPAAEVRYQAALALGRIGHPNAQRPLRALLDDTNALVRRGAAKALIALGDPRGEALLADTARQRLTRSAGKWTGRILAGFVPDTVFTLLWPRSLRAKSTLFGSLATVCMIACLLWFGWSPSSLGRETIILRGHVASLDFDPQASTLAVGRTRGVIELWDLPSGELRRQTEAAVGGIAGIRYLADADTLVFAIGSKLRFWKDAAVGELTGHGRAIQAFVVTPDRTTAATWSGGREVVLWGLATRRKQAIVKLPGDDFTTLDLSPDGSWLAAGTRKGIVIGLDASTTNEATPTRFAGLEGSSIVSVAFSSDGTQLAAATDDGGLSVWNAASGQRLATGRDRPGISRMAFVPGPVGDPAPSPPAPLPQGEGGGVRARLAGRVVILRGSRVRLWSLQSGEFAELPQTQTEGYDVLSISDDGRFLAVSGHEDNAVWVFDLRASRLLHKLDISR